MFWWLVGFEVVGVTLFLSGLRLVYRKKDKNLVLGARLMIAGQAIIMSVIIVNIFTN